MLENAIFQKKKLLRLWSHLDLIRSGKAGDSKFTNIMPPSKFANPTFLPFKIRILTIFDVFLITDRRSRFLIVAAKKSDELFLWEWELQTALRFEFKCFSLRSRFSNSETCFALQISLTQSLNWSPSLIESKSSSIITKSRLTRMKRFELLSATNCFWP